MGSPSGTLIRNRIWKLSPSDFAFLWEECKRCFYLKVVKGFYRPRGAFPKIFGVIDSEMKKCFQGVRLETVASGMPAGLVAYEEEWVESAPIALPGRSSRIVLRGKFDTAVKFDDSAYGVIDYKTSEAKAEHVPFYSRQLHAYAYALENPAPGSFGLSPISKLGLLVFEPNAFSKNGCDAALAGSLSWLEIPRDESAFLRFLGEVLPVLEQPEPPEGDPGCEWCRYRHAGRKTSL